MNQPTKIFALDLDQELLDQLSDHYLEDLLQNFPLPAYPPSVARNPLGDLKQLITDLGQSQGDLPVRIRVSQESFVGYMLKIPVDENGQTNLLGDLTTDRFEFLVHPDDYRKLQTKLQIGKPDQKQISSYNIGIPVILEILETLESENPCAPNEPTAA